MMNFVRSMCSAAKSIRPPIPVFGVEGRYVSALYSAASQMNQLDDTEKHLQNMFELLSKPKMIDFIETSFISASAKAKLLGDAAKQAGMPTAAINFLTIVAENNRLKKLKRMITMFAAVMVAHRKEALCEIITAKPLDESSRNTVVEALKKLVKDNKDIRLSERVDPSIIGGMIIGIEDKHIDMSISRKIQIYTDILKESI